MVSVSSAPLSSKPAPSQSRQSGPVTPGSGSEIITPSGIGPKPTLRTVDSPCAMRLFKRRDPGEIADIQPFERHHDRAAAALTEAWAERETLEPAHVRTARAVFQHLPRGFDRFPFQMAAADGVACIVACDDHLRARFARRRAFHARDRHQHDGVAVREEVLQIV